MDPTACLKEIRELIEDHTECDTLPSDDLDRLMDLLMSLDTWMSKGGHCPQQWMKHRDA
jgi:hypothetical protein